MNKKTIAIAALALLATSGLASARTIHSPRNAQASQTETVAPAARFSSLPYNALNQYGGGAENQVFSHPGDNDMDRYRTEYTN